MQIKRDAYLQQFYDQFINITGAGITIGLVMYMFFFAKSKQLPKLKIISIIIPDIIFINHDIYMIFQH